MASASNDTPRRPVPSLPVLLSLLALASLPAGCASGTKQAQTAEDQPGAPAILSARAQPATFELNRSFQPARPAEVIADVADYGTEVTDVKLQFVDVPLEIPLENIGGSKWRTQLSPRQLEMLAVSGQTTRYVVNVVARNSEGKTTITANPLEVAVKAPDFTATGSG